MYEIGDGEGAHRPSTKSESNSSGISDVWIQDTVFQESVGVELFGVWIDGLIVEHAPKEWQVLSISFK
jgi:hypothetical protein